MSLPKTTKMRLPRVAFMSPILALEPGLSATTAVAFHATFVTSNNKESIQSANGQTLASF